MVWRICILMSRRKGLKELLKTSYITQTSAKIVKVEYTKTTSWNTRGIFLSRHTNHDVAHLPLSLKKKNIHTPNSPPCISKNFLLAKLVLHQTMSRRLYFRLFSSPFRLKTYRYCRKKVLFGHSWEWKGQNIVWKGSIINAWISQKRFPTILKVPCVAHHIPFLYLLVSDVLVLPRVGQETPSHI